MTALVSILLLVWAINQLCRVLSDIAQDVSEYKDKCRRIKRIQRAIKTDAFMRDNTMDETTRSYYAEQVKVLTDKLRRETNAAE